MTKDNPKGDDARSGYGRPPKHSQFKKGQSGNPKGRPQKVQQVIDGRTIDNFYREFSRRLVPVKINGKTMLMPMLEAIVHAHFTQAMKGDLPALKVLIKVLREVQGPLTISEADIDEAIAQLQARVDELNPEGDKAPGTSIKAPQKEPGG